MKKSLKPTVSVIIPVFNDAERARARVPELTAWLTQRRIAFEILLVDDGSEDPSVTASVARALRARFVKGHRNQGKGAAVRKGMLAARGEFCIFTDSDVPYDFDALWRMLSRLEKGIDMVFGDRSDVRSTYRDSTPLKRRITSRVFRFLLGRVLPLSEHGDTQCGLKGFRREVARDLFSSGFIDGFAFDVELFVVAHLRGYSLEEVPVQLRYHDTSSLHLFVDGKKMVEDLIVIRRHLLAGRYSSAKPKRVTKRAA